MRNGAVSLESSRSIAVPIEHGSLAGELNLPLGANGIVVFAHGSGSSRLSPRNQYVAQILREHGLGTLLIDLLTWEEEKRDRLTRALRFDIALLARRLQAITQWIGKQSFLDTHRVGYFGASTGGAAALIAASRASKRVGAVVSRGGRPDLAKDWLSLVEAPTLLIVGERDPQVLIWNKPALKRLNEQSRLDIIPGATHLFEEPGTLEAVAQLAANWFKRYLS